MLFPKGLLQRVHILGGSKSLNRGDFATVGLDREHEA
jgi:hypothetical protein